MSKPVRNMANRGRVTQETCPTCKGSGKYKGPVPYDHCLRCGGYGTIILIEKEAA